MSGDIRVISLVEWFVPEALDRAEAERIILTAVENTPGVAGYGEHGRSAYVIGLMIVSGEEGDKKSTVFYGMDAKLVEKLRAWPWVDLFEKEGGEKAS